jgi:hypothetical protein
MNDYSNAMFTRVASAVEARHRGCTCSTAPFSSDVSLPALYVRFAFPGMDEQTADSSGEEVFTLTTCVADAYSGTSMQAAKAIISTMDAEMRRMGFRRSAWDEVPNADATIRRVQAKWRAKVGMSGQVAAW